MLMFDFVNLLHCLWLLMVSQLLLVGQQQQAELAAVRMQEPRELVDSFDLVVVH